MSAVLRYFSENFAEYLRMIAEHLEVSLLAVLFAMIIAIPLGIFSTRCSWLEKLSTGFWSALRIVPSLAILVILIPVMGTGMKPAVTALTILAVPPILLNTTLAFRTLPLSVIEAGLGMGMSNKRLFFTVKVPLAFPVVFTGVRTAVVEVVASATLAAYIGAGGLGTLIFTGLGLMREDLLWIGGISVAVLSLGIGALLDWVERRATRYAHINE